MIIFNKISHSASMPQNKPVAKAKPAIVNTNSVDTVSFKGKLPGKDLSKEIDAETEKINKLLKLLRYLDRAIIRTEEITTKMEMTNDKLGIKSSVGKKVKE